MDIDKQPASGEVDDSDIDVCVVDDEPPSFEIKQEHLPSSTSRPLQCCPEGNENSLQSEGCCSSSTTGLDEEHISNVTVGANSSVILATKSQETSALLPIKQAIEMSKNVPLSHHSLPANSPARPQTQSTSNIHDMKIKTEAPDDDIMETDYSSMDNRNISLKSNMNDFVNASAAEEERAASHVKVEREERTVRSFQDDSESNSEDDDAENAEDLDNRFYFESDHLAFKHNKDYKILLKTLVVLEAQRIQAVADLQDLNKWKENALSNPIPFVESLQSKDPPKFPKKQMVANLPHVDWAQYLATTSVMKMPPGLLANTRRSFRAKGEFLGSEGFQDDNESVSSEGSQDFGTTKATRGRLTEDNNTLSFNRLWTTEEQERLEKLLHIYPPEDIEARRWEKIAKALGNRTAKQVSSRVQKYFIKLARAGLPIPGRPPHMGGHKKSKINPVSYRNSTFFPSWKPSVYMNDDEDDASSVTTLHSDDTPCVSDEEMIPSELKETAEYKELVTLKKYKKQLEEARAGPIHTGYKCDDCGMEPIKGTRWHCSDCKGDTSLDVCNGCMESKPNGFPELHPAWHRMARLKENAEFMDGDYLGFELQHGKYNYLDPNFIPKTR